MPISAAASSAGTKPRVLYEVGYDDTTGAIYAPADASFVAEMVTLAGAETITTGDPNTYEMSFETLIADGPADHRARDEPVLHADAGGGREATWLGRDDRRPQRRRPAGPRHRDHPSGAAVAARPA